MEIFPKKFAPVICMNSVIREHSPLVWQLVPRKEIKTFTKMTVTARNTTEARPKRGNRTVLLLGETGSGKLTLINTVFNFCLGVKWDEEVWFEIAQKEGRDPSDSQTTDVIIYEIKEGEELDFSLTMIDTPGFGDTRGTDEVITQRLTELFSSEGGVGEVHAVGLVLKASENRLSDRMAYVFNSVTSLFGKNMEKNIVALITHSDVRKPVNALQALEAANIQCSRNDKNEPVYFLFDNCQRDDRSEGTQYLELAYDTTKKNMEGFMEFLPNQGSENLTSTRNVLDLRLSLKREIQNLKGQVKSIEDKKKTEQQILEALWKYEQKMEICKNFTFEVIDLYKIKEEQDIKWFAFKYDKAINCVRCEETCWSPGSRWEAVKDGRCTVCPGKCPETDHVKENWKYVEKIRKVTKVDEEKKERYERNKRKHESKFEELKSTQNKMSDLKQIKKKCLHKIFHIIEELEKIALNVNAVSTHVHLDFLIEQMKETGDTEKVQKLERIRDRMDEKNKAGAQYLKIVLKDQ